MITNVVAKVFLLLPFTITLSALLSFVGNDFCSIFGCYLLHRTMKNVLTISILTCVLTFCGRNQAVDESLDRAESCMSASPDSALMILESIDSLHFDSRSQSARYALLKSIALDKNYIDRIDDSLINIAVNYYRHRLNAPYKFKSYYYQARIYQNAGLMDKAMESLVCAEHINLNKISTEDLARLCFTKAQIKFSRFDLSGELDELREAAKYSKISGNDNNYVSAILSQANTYLILRDYHKLDSCLSIVNQHPDLSYHNHLKMLDIKLLYSLNANSSIEVLKSDCEKYINYARSESDLDWKIIAQVYLKIGDADLSEDALCRYLQNGGNINDESYYYLLASVQKSQEDYINAYESIIRYAKLSDSLDLIKINQEVKSVRANYENNLTIIKQRILSVTVAVIFIIIFSLCLFFYCKFRKRELSLRLKYDEIKEEYDELTALTKRLKPIEKLMNTLEKDNNDEHHLLVQRIIEMRVKALSTFLNRDMPDSLSKAAVTLEELLNNRDKVTVSIGLIYAIYFPQFVSKLTDCGLTASEIGYCCLLIIGLKTSELPKVINYSNAYNISSRLRTKLGLKAEDGTLSAWLKKTFNESRVVVSEVHS